MKFAVACFGTRGDIEPCAALGRELQRRGHDVRMAVPAELVGFVETAGLAAVAYGPGWQIMLDAQRNFWSKFCKRVWRVQELIRLRREVQELDNKVWGEVSTTLTWLADGADLLITGLFFDQSAASVAEYYDIPLAALDFYPIRANGQLLPVLPAPLGRFSLTVFDWLRWRVTKRVQYAQRRELGLPEATYSKLRRITRRQSLEIQAYDHEVCFPGLAAEWADRVDQRPFVGALTLALPTDADDEIVSWIGQGSPPIFFGFGSIPVESPSEKLAMISAACAHLGERALVCAGWSDFDALQRFEHVKVVGTMDYAAIFPTCRAVVHHGGSGTTAAGLRSGVPSLILWMDPLQAILAIQVERMKVGIARRFSTATRESLVADLRTVLGPQYVARAREVATRMTKPADSVSAAADLVENFARVRRLA